MDLENSIKKIVRKYSETETKEISKEAILINKKINENTMSLSKGKVLAKCYYIKENDSKFVYLAKKFGSYAITSKKEFLSEGFANMMTLDNKTEFLKLFEELFNEEFRRL